MPAPVWSFDSPILAGLVDDAAVFPPGNAPLPVALAAHRAHTSSSYAAAIGPLLVPASAVADLAALVATDGRPSPRVAVIGRPGVPLEDVVEAAALGADRALTVTGIEVGWSPDWRDVVPPHLPVVLEVPRGPEHDLAFADVRSAVRESRPVSAKFRTGPTPTWPWPSEAELAHVLRFATVLEVPLKLTGGLHHAVRGTHVVDGERQEQHGLVNVLLAVQAARAGAKDAALEDILASRDAGELAARAATLDASVRETFTAYGCCGVTDPLDELADLGLAPRR